MGEVAKEKQKGAVTGSKPQAMECTGKPPGEEAVWGRQNGSHTGPVKLTKVWFNNGWAHPSEGPENKSRPKNSMAAQPVVCDVALKVGENQPQSCAASALTGMALSTTQWFYLWAYCSRETVGCETQIISRGYT